MAKNQDSGENTRAFFASFDRDLWSWRIPQLSLLEGSTSYSGTWPRSGTMRNGRASARSTWVHHIAAGDASSSLGYPTPTATDCTSPRSTKYAQGGTSLSCALNSEARQWPTPITSDAKGSSGPGVQRGQLSEAVHQAEEGRQGATLYPHPRFVEWLMGFPAGWVTDLCPELSQAPSSAPTGAPPSEP